MFPLLQPRNHNNNINNNHKISTYTDGYIQMDMSIPEKKVTKKNILCREALCCVLSSRYQIMPYVHIYIYNVRKSHRKKTNKTKHWTMVLNLFWQLASSSDTAIYIYICVYLHIYIYKYYSFLYIPPQSGSSPASAGSRGTSAGSCRGVTVGPGNKYVLYIYIYMHIWCWYFGEIYVYDRSERYDENIVGPLLL